MDRTPFADLALARRLERTEARASVICAEALARLRVESGAAFEEIAGGYAVFTGVNSPLTQAMGLGLSGPVSEAEMERLENFFRSRGDAARVETCPLADASLIELFGKPGYRVTEYSNVLVRPLERMESWPSGAPGVSIERVGSADADLWARTVAQGFAEHIPVTPEILQVMVLRPAARRSLYSRELRASMERAHCLHFAIAVCKPACYACACLRPWRTDASWP
jgi:hypothetical protein